MQPQVYTINIAWLYGTCRYTSRVACISHLLRYLFLCLSVCLSRWLCVKVYKSTSSAHSLEFWICTLGMASNLSTTKMICCTFSGVVFFPSHQVKYIWFPTVHVNTKHFLWEKYHGIMQNCYAIQGVYGEHTVQGVWHGLSVGQGIQWRSSCHTEHWMHETTET